MGQFDEHDGCLEKPRNTSIYKDQVHFSNTVKELEDLTLDFLWGEAVKVKLAEKPKKASKKYPQADADRGDMEDEE